MRRISIFLFLSMCLGFAKCKNLKPEIIPAILDEFKINQLVIQNELIDAKHLTYVVRHLSYNGYRVSFSPNQTDQPYQSYLIFANLKNFKWNLPTYVPILVVSRIQNEVDLAQVDVTIGSQVLFLDSFSLKVYESYIVNQIHVTKYLGQFQEKSKGRNDLFFVPGKDYLPFMEKRRIDFYGLQIKVATTKTALGISNPADFSNKIIFFPNNDTYDVTNLVTVSENKRYDFNYLLYLKWMETELNFTAKIFLRKDMKVGSPKILSNGSFVLGDGAFRDMFEGSVDLLCGAFKMLPERAQFGTFLPSMDNLYDQIYIRNENSAEHQDWNAFISPFSTEMWMAIIIKCFVFSIFAYIIEWFHDYKLALYSIFYKIWASFIPNFGGTPFPSNTDYIASYNTLAFVFMVDGLVLWVTYQSFLYSELSKPLIKNPFYDLNTLANSEYMLYTGPKDQFVFNVLSGPAFKKVMENNVDLELSFNDWDVSKEKTLKEPKGAYFSDSESSVNSEYKCQFKKAWRSDSFLGISLIMNKKSQFTKIFSQAILDMKSNGRLEIFQARKSLQNKQSCIISDPKQKPLGFKKLALLFVVLVSGIFISIFVVLFEFIVKIIYSEKQKGTTTIEDNEINSENDHIEEIMNASSVEEAEKVLKRILKRQ